MCPAHTEVLIKLTGEILESGCSRALQLQVSTCSRAEPTLLLLAVVCKIEVGKEVNGARQGYVCILSNWTIIPDNNPQTAEILRMRTSCQKASAQNTW